jgi:hypothetical protein
MILYIRQLGSFIHYKGKKYRTPIKINITDNDKEAIEKILRYQSISDYVFIDDNNPVNDKLSIEKTNNRMKNYLDYSLNQIPKKDNKVIKSRVVENIKNLDIPMTNYHETIENDKIDIDIDLNSDDILEQLLAKI